MKLSFSSHQMWYVIFTVSLISISAQLEIFPDFLSFFAKTELVKNWINIKGFRQMVEANHKHEAFLIHTSMNTQQEFLRVLSRCASEQNFVYSCWCMFMHVHMYVISGKVNRRWRGRAALQEGKGKLEITFSQSPNNILMKLLCVCVCAKLIFLCFRYISRLFYICCAFSTWNAIITFA